MEETPPSTRKRNYVIPKKSARAPKESEADKEESAGDAGESSRDVPGPSRSFKDEMLPAETAQVVRPKTKKGSQVTFVGETAEDSAATTSRAQGQFEKDLAVQWKMVFDEDNLARRQWRYRLGETQRKEWVRTKPIRSEYSLMVAPRSSSQVIFVKHHFPLNG